MAKNTSTKGGSIELHAKKTLEAAGYLAIKSERSPVVQWIYNKTLGKQEQKILGSRSNDFFNAFDLIAVRRDRNTRYIQVTDTNNFGARQKKVELVARCFPPTDHLEVWGWVGGRKRIDKRYKGEKRYIRRQYFRKVIWRNGGWVDVTPPTAGYIDGWVPSLPLQETGT